MLLPFNNATLITGPFSNAQTQKSMLNFFCYHQLNAQRLLLALEYCRACGNQVIDLSSDKKTVLSSSRKLGGAA